MLRSLLVLTSLTCLSSSLVAQSPDDMGIDTELLDLLELLNTPVQGASKREQRLIESPQAIEVLTGDEIRQMGAYKISDALRLMTSVDVMELDTQCTYVTLRGAMQQGAPRTVQILIDGVPLHHFTLGAVDIDNLPVTVDLIDRIEVVRGPSSSLYGANAVVGVIAITTRHGGKGSQGGVRLSRANHSVWRGAADMTLVKNGLSVSATYSGASFRAWPYLSRNYDLMAKPAIYQGDNATHQHAAFTRLQYENENSKYWMSFGEGIKTGGTNIEFRQYMPYQKPWVRTMQAGWGRTWASEFKTEVRASRLTHRFYSGKSVLMIVDPWMDTTSDLFELQGNWDPSASLHFVAGMDTRVIKMEPSPRIGITQKREDSATGGFLNIDWAFLANFNLSAGARVENETLGGSRVSPRAAVSWSPSKSSSLRAGYYSSTRSPQIIEKHFDITVPAVEVPPNLENVVAKTVPNLGLEPEKVSSIELGYRQQMGSFTLDMTLFQMSFSKLIAHTSARSFIPGSPSDPRPILLVLGKYQNLGDSTNQGLEVAGKWVIKKEFSVGANFTWMDYTLDNVPGQLTYAPKFKANLWTRYNWKGFSGMLSYQYNGDITMDAKSIAGNPITPSPRKAFHQFNANLNYEILKGLKIGAYARNAARDMTMQGAGGTSHVNDEMGARREIGGSLSYRF